MAAAAILAAAVAALSAMEDQAAIARVLPSSRALTTLNAVHQLHVLLQQHHQPPFHWRQASARDRIGNQRLILKRERAYKRSLPCYV